MTIMKPTFSDQAKAKRNRISANTRQLEQHILKEEKYRIGLGDREELSVIDIELTNRCNASCSFCPRDKTPHQGHMTEEIFELTLNRIHEFTQAIESEKRDCGVRVSFCGLGEPCLHPNLPQYISRVVDAGVNPGMASNASLLTEQLSNELLDAGLHSIYFNVGEIGESYRDVYGLEFETTLANIERFNTLAASRCHVFVVVPDHRVDDNHVNDMKQFWRDRGITLFFNSAIINRAGAVKHDILNFDDHQEETIARSILGDKPPGCIAPLIHTFVGYDGTYYLCNSDWEREAPAGTVFDRSILESMALRLKMAQCRDDNICRKCNHDPLNQIMRMRATGATPDAVSAAARHYSEYYEGSVRFISQFADGGHIPQELRLPSLY